MKNLEIELSDRPGALAAMGAALGAAGVSIEGGGAFVIEGRGIGHFLFKDAAVARRVLESAGIRVLDENDVIALRLKQAVPGQLGTLTQRMAAAGVNIQVVYSDHERRLILVVDKPELGKTVADQWSLETKVA